MGIVQPGYYSTWVLFNLGTVQPEPGYWSTWVLFNQTLGNRLLHHLHKVKQHSTLEKRLISEKKEYIVGGAGLRPKRKVGGEGE